MNQQKCRTIPDIYAVFWYWQTSPKFTATNLPSAAGLIGAVLEAYAEVDHMAVHESYRRLFGESAPCTCAESKKIMEATYGTAE